ncbi:hypothetical protein ACFFS3_09880 [Nocardioides luteus]|nr:hypothetical protein [Nocardioides luteus]GLJ66805.1 hypothetical protein GCM10017579_08410 [Nocardioides luteus]
MPPRRGMQGLGQLGGGRRDIGHPPITGQQPAIGGQQGPLQPLPTRQPAASGSPQAGQPGEGIGGMFAQRPQRPTQLRPQNGRWTPRPYAQQAPNGAPEQRQDFFNPQGGQRDEAGPEQPQQPGQPPRSPRNPGWLPPRNNNL